MPCTISSTRTWVPQLQIGLDTKQYVVELKRNIHCCSEDYQIFVNGQELEEHSLTCTAFGPLCSAGGAFEWEQEGHNFHIILDTFSWRSVNKHFRLFVDGIDMESGLEFTAFWRRRGIQLFVLGSVLVFIGALAYILVFLVFKVSTNYLGNMAGANVAFVFGVMYMIFALILFNKYNQPKSCPPPSFSTNVDYQSFKNQPV